MGRSGRYGNFRFYTLVPESNYCFYGGVQCHLVISSLMLVLHLGEWHLTLTGHCLSAITSPLASHFHAHSFRVMQNVKPVNLMVMGPIPHHFYCELVSLIECCCVWNAAPVDQDFRKSLDRGSMERKDKQMHGLSVYSWGTNQWFFQDKRGKCSHLVTKWSQFVSLRNSVINLTCHWQVDLTGSSSKMTGNLCCWVFALTHLFYRGPWMNVPTIPALGWILANIGWYQPSHFAYAWLLISPT